MTSFSLMFLGVAIVSGAFGFGDAAGASAQVARVLSVTFTLIFAVNFFIHLRKEMIAPKTPR